MAGPRASSRLRKEFKMKVKKVNLKLKMVYFSSFYKACDIKLERISMDALKRDIDDRSVQ